MSQVEIYERRRVINWQKIKNSLVYYFFSRKVDNTGNFSTPYEPSIVPIVMIAFGSSTLINIRSKSTDGCWPKSFACGAKCFSFQNTFATIIGWPVVGVIQSVGTRKMDHLKCPWTRCFKRRTLLRNWQILFLICVNETITTGICMTDVYGRALVVGWVELSDCELARATEFTQELSELVVL
jgi:hypothetical protein